MGKSRDLIRGNAERFKIVLDRFSHCIEGLIGNLSDGRNTIAISGSDCGFIILTDQRSGSHYLRSLIDCHPRIACAGEVLSNTHRTPQMIGKFLEGDFSVIYDFKKSFERRDHDCIGFIVHGHQLDWKARREMRRMGSLKIIFLERENLLRRYISLMAAKRSDKFMREAGQAELKADPITIDPKMLQNDINMITRRRIWLRKLFSGNESMTVSYEQLCSDESGTVNQIFDFLSMPRVKVQSNKLKQMNKTLRESVANYEQLKSEFKGTRWYHFFDE